ncbi:uncharacterized protein LOC124957509 [Vespa velutina]|uniref:uncharacterized protein LOC124957509 n=1 Tax=Vespa velutina TaxID=202808 RepID=UPI001FB2E33C|nr:uncharacterized protein LOC124957509 [Vespa velutina]
MSAAAAAAAAVAAVAAATVAATVVAVAAAAAAAAAVAVVFAVGYRGQPPSLALNSAFSCAMVSLADGGSSARVSSLSLRVLIPSIIILWEFFISPEISFLRLRHLSLELSAAMEVSRMLLSTLPVSTWDNGVSAGPPSPSAGQSAPSSSSSEE